MAQLTNRRIIIIALVLALAAAIVSYQLIHGATVAAKEQVPVVVAMQDIPANTTISREMVTVQNIPQDYAHPQALSSPEQAVGKISRIDLLRGEQILPNKVASRDQPGNRFAYRIEDGHRAITLAVNEVTGVGGFLAVGDRVDVLQTRERAGVAYTSTILQNKEILATGSMTVPMEDGKQRVVPTITMLLTPMETQQITLAEETGKVKFTLRTPTDEEIPQLEAVSYVR